MISKEMYVNFCTYVKELLKDADMHCYDLAGILGIGLSMTYNKIADNGSHFTINEMVYLADYFDFDLVKVLKGQLRF